MSRNYECSGSHARRDFFSTCWIHCSVVWFLPSVTRPARRQYATVFWKMSIHSPAKCEKRSVIRYLFWKGKPAVKVFNEVENACGDNDLNRTSMFKWSHGFKNSRMSVNDGEKSGSPSIDWLNWGKNWKCAPWRSQIVCGWSIYDVLQISRSMQHKTTTETLEYRKLSARRVPKQLTDQHKFNRVEAEQGFLRRYKLCGEEFLWFIFTEDKTWMHMDGKRFWNVEGWRGRWRVDEDVCGKLLRGRHQKINTPANNLHWAEWWLCRNMAYMSTNVRFCFQIKHNLHLMYTW